MPAVMEIATGPKAGAMRAANDIAVALLNELVKKPDKDGHVLAVQGGGRFVEQLQVRV